MDFLAHIQMMRVPVWARMLIYGGFLGIVSVCAFLAWSALRWQAPESWLGASVALFAAIFPLMIVVLVATTVHTGEKAIREHTDRFLVHTIPLILSRIPEDEAVFSSYHSGYRSGERGRFADITISHRAGDCFADYRIEFEEERQLLSMVIRVELNVKRLNFNLYLPVQRIDENVRQHDSGGSQLTVDQLRQTVFKHTLDAAAVGPDVDSDSPSSGAYVFHREIFSRVIEGTRWYVLVGSCPVSRDLLWNPAERLFVAQDLMFMLRAMIGEGASLFGRQ